LRGSDRVEKQDLLDLCYLPGMEQFAANLKAELDAAYERAEAEHRLSESERKLQTLLEELSAAKDSPIKLLQVAKRLLAFQDEVAKLKVTDGLTDRRKRVRDSASEKAAEAQRLALDNTRA